MESHHPHGRATRRGRPRSKAAAFFDPLAYPFAQPDGSYLMEPACGRMRPVRLLDLNIGPGRRHPGFGTPPLSADLVLRAAGTDIALRGRIPVIAAGSNASPQQLARKYAGSGYVKPFAVMAAQVRGLVPVYSAHFARYGAIPATLHAESEVVSVLYIKFLTPRQLMHLTASEAPGVNYALEHLSGLRIELGPGLSLRSACFFRSLHGAFAPDGAPVRLNGAGTRRSRLPEADQPSVLRLAASALGVDLAPRDLANRLARDDRLRKEMSARLPRLAPHCLTPKARPLR